MVLITVVAVPAFVHRVKIVVAKLDIELITIFTCHPINFGNVSVIYWKRFSDIKVTIFFFDTWKSCQQSLKISQLRPSKPMISISILDHWPIADRLRVHHGIDSSQSQCLHIICWNNPSNGNAVPWTAHPPHRWDHPRFSYQWLSPSFSESTFSQPINLNIVPFYTWHTTYCVCTDILSGAVWPNSIKPPLSQKKQLAITSFVMPHQPWKVNWNLHSY